MKLLRRVAYLSVLTVVVPNVVNAQEPLLNLQEAVSIAVQEDPWLTASKQTQEAFASEAIASSSLPDPQISLTAASFPVDSFSSRQEGMAQLVVGVSQAFPRGDTLSLSRKQKNQRVFSYLVRAVRIYGKGKGKTDLRDSVNARDYYRSFIYELSKRYRNSHYIGNFASRIGGGNLANVSFRL